MIVLTPSQNPTTVEKFSRTLLVRFRYFFLTARLTGGVGMPTNLKKSWRARFELPFLTVRFLYFTWKLRYFSHVVHANWLYCGFIAMFAEFVTGVPYVLTLRGSDFRLLNNQLIRACSKIVLHRAAQVTCVSSEIYDGIRNLFPDIGPAKLHLIRNGVDPSEELNNFSPRAERSCIFIGRLTEEKGAGRAIDIIGGVEGLQFQLFGSPGDAIYCTRLTRFVIDRGMESRIKLRDEISHSEVLKQLSAARYFVSFSKHEGIPNAMLEALAAGCIVLASDIAGHREIITSGKNGFLFPIDQSDEFGGNAATRESVARVIESIDGNDETYRSLQRAARESVSDFSWDETARRYVEVLDKATASETAK